MLCQELGAVGRVGLAKGYAWINREPCDPSEGTQGYRVGIFVVAVLGFVLRRGLAMKPRLALNSKSSCLSRLSVRMTGMSHHTHLECHFCETGQKGVCGMAALEFPWDPTAMLMISGTQAGAEEQDG